MKHRAIDPGIPYYLMSATELDMAKTLALLSVGVMQALAIRGAVPDARIAVDLAADILDHSVKKIMHLREF